MMSRFTKTIIVLAGLAILAAGTFFVPGGARASVAAQTTPQPVDRRTVSVSGQGATQVQPDRAFITLGVQTDGDTASAALTENNTQMQALLTALRSAGVANADIQTRSVQLYPRYDPQPTPVAEQEGQAAQDQITGFTAANTVEVTVRDLDNLGELLDEAVQAGGNRIENIRFDVASPSTVLDDAREAAFQDATRKAEQLATLAGMELGPVVTITENSYYPFAVQQESLRAMDQAAGAVPVSPGTQTLTVDVLITFELQATGTE
jgi:uncharacterized protein YggE